MKKMMMAAVMAAFLSIFSFSSCIDNGGVNYDKNTGPTCDITLQKVNMFVA